MKILCIQLRQMGDVIMTTAAVRQLRTLYPDAHITFMSEPLGANVYQNSPRIDRLWVIKRKQSALETLKLFWQVNREKYDLVIDFFSNPKSAQITLASMAKRRIGFDFRGRKHAYTDPISLKEAGDEYAVHSKNRLIEPLGGSIEDEKIEFFTNETSEKYAKEFALKNSFADNTIAFCVVSRREYKILPPQFFATVGDLLIESGYKLFFVYGPNEKKMALDVFNLLKNPQNAIIDYEIPSVQETRATLGYCKAYVGNDGGSKHMSVCAKIPTITVFQKAKAINWTQKDETAFQLEDGVYPEQVFTAVIDRLK